MARFCPNTGSSESPSDPFNMVDHCPPKNGVVDLLKGQKETPGSFEGPMFFSTHTHMFRKDMGV